MKQAAASEKSHDMKSLSKVMAGIQRGIFGSSLALPHMGRVSRVL
jgi:hypothetical protein